MQCTPRNVLLLAIFGPLLVLVPITRWTLYALRNRIYPS